MSTNIWNCWLLHTQDLELLTKIGNHLESLWQQSWLDETLDSLAVAPWWRADAQNLQEIDPNFAKVRHLAYSTFGWLMAMHTHSPLVLFTSAEKTVLKALLSVDSGWNAFPQQQQAFVTELFEKIICHLQRSSAGIIFIPWFNGCTCMKIFGGTKSINDFLKAQGTEALNYTDACEMDVSDLGWETRHKIIGETDEDKKYELLMQEQTKRGKRWDAVFETFGSCQFGKIGLQKEFCEDFLPQKIANRVQELLQILAAMDIEKEILIFKEIKQRALVKQ